MRDLLYLVFLQSLVPGVDKKRVVPYFFVLRIRFINVHRDENEGRYYEEVGGRNEFKAQKYCRSNVIFNL